MNNKKILDIYFETIFLQKKLEKNMEILENINISKFEEKYEEVLSEREKKILFLKKINKKNYKEYAREKGYSYAYIRKIASEALQKLEILIDIYKKGEK